MDTTIITKQCSKCKQILPVSEFWQYPKRNKYHYSSWCKECTKEYRRTDKGKKINRRTAKKFAQSKRGKEYNNQWSKQNRKNHPNKALARSTISNATRDGKLPRAKTLSCQMCNKPAHTYHHHLGYAQEHWLDVIPLCKNCHYIIHHSTTTHSKESFQTKSTLREAPVLTLGIP